MLYLMINQIIIKMKNRNLIILAVTLFSSLFFSCNNAKEPWNIKSKIEIAEVPEAYLYKVNADRTDVLIDSTNVTDHNFVFSGINDSDSLGVYRIKFSKGHGNGINVFINNGDKVDIEILGEYKNIYSGNSIQDAYTSYLKVKQKEVDLMKELMTRMNPKATPEQLEASRTWYVESTKKLDQDKADVISKINIPELNAYLALDEIYTSSISDKNKFELLSNSLTKEGKETIYGKNTLEILQYFDAYNLLFQSIQMDYETLHQKYEQLDKANKDSKFGIEIANKLSVLENLGYGKKAPLLEAKTISGKKFDLNQIKAKITLVDFWASWCGPCREENKNYVNLYKQFNSKGFEIVGYSLDTDANNWKKAVKNDGLIWTNVSNLKKQKEDNILKSYQIDAVPSNIILKDGKIIARNLFGYELEDFLNQNLY